MAIAAISVLLTMAVAVDSPVAAAKRRSSKRREVRSTRQLNVGVLCQVPAAPVTLTGVVRLSEGRPGFLTVPANAFGPGIPPEAVTIMVRVSNLFGDFTVTISAGSIAGFPAADVILPAVVTGFIGFTTVAFEVTFPAGSLVPPGACTVAAINR